MAIVVHTRLLLNPFYIAGTKRSLYNDSARRRHSLLVVQVDPVLLEANTMQSWTKNSWLELSTHYTHSISFCGTMIFAVGWLLL